MAGKFPCKIIRANGSVEFYVVDTTHSLKEIEKLIDSSLFDSVRFADNTVMLVDDEGYAKQKRVNQQATMLYWSVCAPGTDYLIVGDVAIIHRLALE
jgi:Domain of unknown function (DUF3846)